MFSAHISWGLLLWYCDWSTSEALLFFLVCAWMQRVLCFFSKNIIFFKFFQFHKINFFHLRAKTCFIMASSSPDSIYFNWFLKLPATWWGTEWAKDKYGPEYDKHFDRMKLFAYLPGSTKTEPAYKFDWCSTKNYVIGISDLNLFNGQGLLLGHNIQL